MQSMSENPKQVIRQNQLSNMQWQIIPSLTKKYNCCIVNSIFVQTARTFHNCKWKLTTCRRYHVVWCCYSNNTL